MGLQKRTGEYGEYYGNDFNSSTPLNKEQRELNAKYILKGLGNKGFTINAISAMLGNMQVESSINPGRWEKDIVGGDPKNHGYGLVQWTPYTKYTNWCSGDPSTMDNNIARIVYEVERGVQWSTYESPYKESFWDFSRSKKSPDYLAMVFLRNYEKPQDINQPKRGEYALEWYNYLTSVTPKPIPIVRVQNTHKWCMYKAFKVRINIRK